MLKKIAGITFFTAVLVVSAVSAQTIDVDIMSEEILRWNDTAYHALHLYINTHPNEYTDTSIIKEICNGLQRSNLFSDVNLNNIQTINGASVHVVEKRKKV